MIRSAQRPVAIVTDSTADIPAGLLADRDIEIVPLTVRLGNAEYVDGIELGPEDLLAAMRDGIVPQTSQPSIGAFTAVYAKLLDAGSDIVSIHLSGAVSGTVNAARAAAAQLDEQRIRVIDTRSLSMGLGWLAVEAADLAARGGTLDALAGAVERRIVDHRLFATLETLEYLQRGGRIGRAAGLVGTLLQIKPILEVREGIVQPFERPRTHRRAFSRLVELAREHAPWDRLAVMHFGAPEEADLLAAELTDLQPEPQLEIVRGVIGPVVGSHTGPGIYGITGLVRR